MKPSLAFKKPLTFHLKPLTLFIGLLFAVFFFYSLSYAQVPQIMNYQGKLTTPAGAIVDTTVSMEFKIYDDSVGGTILWSETQSSARVENGIFSVLLGSLNPIPFDIWGGGHRYLGVTIGTSPEMTPRKLMVSVPYAQHSGDWALNGNNIYRLNGNVGIGTANPQALFQVGEPFVVTAGEDVGISYPGSPEYTPDAKLEIVREPSKDLLMLSSTANADGDLVIVKNSGNVGIGTATPDSKLDIEGSANGALLTITNTSNSTQSDIPRLIDGTFNWGTSDHYRFYVGHDGNWGALRMQRTDPGDSCEIGLMAYGSVSGEGLNYIKSCAGAGFSNSAAIRVNGSINDAIPYIYFCVDKTYIGEPGSNPQDGNGNLYVKGNVGIGTTDQFGGGAGVLSLHNAATNPSGTLTNAALFFVKNVSGTSEMFVMDGAGNQTQISPHDPETGEWIFYCKNTKTGRVVRVDMERLVKKVEVLTGEKFMIESWEEGN